MHIFRASFVLTKALGQQGTVCTQITATEALSIAYYWHWQDLLQA